MCVESYELVTEDMGEVVAWKVFLPMGDGIVSLAQGIQAYFPYNKWLREYDYRENVCKKHRKMSDGCPFGFMAFPTLDDAMNYKWHLAIRKVRLRGVRATGLQKNNQGEKIPCLIAREMLILPEGE